MDVQAYRVAVRLALDDQITRNMMRVAKDAIELNKKFVEMAKNIKVVTSAAKEATSAIRSLNNALSNQFSGASRRANEYANAMRSAADHAVRASNATRNLPVLAGGYGAVLALPAIAAGAAAARGGGGGGFGNSGGMLALPSPSGSGTGWNGWNNGVPPGGWGGGGSGGGGGAGNGRNFGRSSHSDGMTNLATGYFGLKLLDGFVDEAAKYQTMTEKFNQYGMDEAARKDAENFAQTTKILGTSTTDMLKYFTEAQGVFRESGAATLDEQLRAAKMAAPVLARINFASQGLDEHAKEMTTSKQMDMLRFVETAGGLKSPQRFNELMDAGFKAIQSSGGNVDFTQYRQFMAKAGTSAFNLSNKALFAELEPIIGELKGSSAGDALMTSYNRLNGIDKLTGVGQLAELGVDARDNLFHQYRRQRLIDRPHVRLGDGVRQHLRGAGVVFELEQRVVAAGAVAPEAGTVLANKRGDVRLVEQVGIGSASPVSRFMPIYFAVVIVVPRFARRYRPDVCVCAGLYRLNSVSLRCARCLLSWCRRR